MQFLSVAIELDLLDDLAAGTSVERLARERDLANRDSLRLLLDLGVALGELKRQGTGYRAKRCGLGWDLARPTRGPARASIRELVDYHGAIHRDLGGHLREGRKRAYLEGLERVIAESSRLLEPMLGVFVRDLVRGAGSVRILEWGCGSGVYLHHMAVANPLATGVGLERSPEVAAAARAALAQEGLDDRFEVVCADARDMEGLVSGRFDLATLHNNVYYVASGERVELFRQIGALLSSDGRLAVTSMRGRGLATLALDLALAAMAGCTRLPIPSVLEADLRAAEFTLVRWSRLLPVEPFGAVVASEFSGVTMGHRAGTLE